MRRSECAAECAPVEKRKVRPANTKTLMEGHGTLRCPSCGHGNRSDRRYCAECGSWLGAACRACGTRSEPSEKFCGNCGAALREDTAVPRRTEAPLPAPDAAAGE